MRLVARLPNWVGDVVMATPTLVQLRDMGFQLTLLGRPWANDLLSGYGFDVRTASRGVRKIGGELRSTGIRRGVLFPNSISSALSMRLARIQAVGYRTDGRGLLLHRAIPKPSGLHEVEFFWDLGKLASDCWAAGPDRWPDAPPERFTYPITDAARAGAARALAQHQVDEPFLVVCPGGVADARRQTKIWPRFYDFCHELVREGHRVVACPAPDEVWLYRELLSDVTIIPGLSLSEFAAVLDQADKVVASDTGPMHMAGAVAAPCLGIFGPTTPERTRAWNGNHVGGIAGQWPAWEEVRAAFEALPVRQAAPTVGNPAVSKKAAVG